MPPTQALHLLISGRVQGVGYRYATCKKALELGITGWVKNLPDGRVEAWIEGSEEDQQQLLQWCYQGPAFAKVTEIEIKTKNVIEAPSKTFSIR